MSKVASVTKEKKRKQVPAGAGDALGPSAKKSRKEKRATGAPAASTSVAGITPSTSSTINPATLDATSSPLVKDRKKKKEKGKGKGKTSEEDSEFAVVRSSVVVSIPPVFAGDPRSGVEEMLDSMVMRYIPALQGVVLAHSNLTFSESKARLIAECPFAVTTVEFDATTWSPRVGMKLTAQVKLCSPDHIALLAHRTFNISIPKHHIPQDQWVFEYGPAENDPEFGAGANGDEVEDATTTEGMGRWAHRLTGENIGGEEGLLELTVVGLTMANQMLSLVGSLQADPFAPEHVPNTIRSDGDFAEEPLQPKTMRPALVVDEEGDPIDTEQDDEELPDIQAVAAAAEARREEERKKEKKRKKDVKESKKKARGGVEGEKGEERKRKKPS